jgi:hypothetical protein
LALFQIKKRAPKSEDIQRKNGVEQLLEPLITLKLKCPTR